MISIRCSFRYPIPSTLSSSVPSWCRTAPGWPCILITATARVAASVVGRDRPMWPGSSRPCFSPGRHVLPTRRLAHMMASPAVLRLESESSAGLPRVLPVARVREVLHAARTGDVRFFFTRHLSLPTKLMGIMQYRRSEWCLGRALGRWASGHVPPHATGSGLDQAAGTAPATAGAGRCGAPQAGPGRRHP